jgi:hypothetical protein
LLAAGIVEPGPVECGREVDDGDGRRRGGLGFRAFLAVRSAMLAARPHYCGWRGKNAVVLLPFRMNSVIL